MVMLATSTCSFRLDRISTLPIGIQVYPASLSQLSGHSFVAALQTQWRLCYSISHHPPSPTLPRWHHLKPAFGGTPPPLSYGVPYNSNPLPARDCTIPPGYSYSIVTFESLLPQPISVPRLGFFSLCRPALPYHLLVTAFTTVASYHHPC